MPDSTKKPDFSPDKPLKILIIDDSALFQKMIGECAEMLGYSWQAVGNAQEALIAIKEAEEEQEPFSVVIIDTKYEIGEAKVRMGKTLLRIIKSQYSHIACIVTSGSGLSAEKVLDMRDDYGLDYYIPKDRLDLDTLDEGIKKAVERVRSLRTDEERLQRLQITLDRYRDNRAIYLHNLSLAEEKKAKRGLDVSIETENEIAFYKQKIKETRQAERQLEQEIKKLQAS